MLNMDNWIKKQCFPPSIHLFVCLSFLIFNLIVAKLTFNWLWNWLQKSIKNGFAIILIELNSIKVTEPNLNRIKSYSEILIKNIFRYLGGRLCSPLIWIVKITWVEHIFFSCQNNFFVGIWSWYRIDYDRYI